MDCGDFTKYLYSSFRWKGAATRHVIHTHPLAIPYRVAGEQSGCLISYHFSLRCCVAAKARKYEWGRDWGDSPSLLLSDPGGHIISYCTVLQVSYPLQLLFHLPSRTKWDDIASFFSSRFCSTTCVKLVKKEWPEHTSIWCLVLADLIWTLWIIYRSQEHDYYC